MAGSLRQCYWHAQPVMACLAPGRPLTARAPVNRGFVSSSGSSFVNGSIGSLSSSPGSNSSSNNSNSSWQGPSWPPLQQPQATSSLAPSSTTGSSGEYDEGSERKLTLREVIDWFINLPWQKAASWVLVACFASLLKDFFGVSTWPRCGDRMPRFGSIPYDSGSGSRTTLVA